MSNWKDFGDSHFGLYAGLGLLFFGASASMWDFEDTTKNTTNIDVPEDSMVIPNDIFNQCASGTVQISKIGEDVVVTCPASPAPTP